MEYKVIFHIDENARWQMLLGNVENLLGALGSGHMTVEVLANEGIPAPGGRDFCRMQECHEGQPSHRA